MFKYFKTKSRAIKDSFEQGFKKATKSRNKFWRGKINKIRIEAETMLKEKNNQIDWRDKRIAKIENQLDKFIDIISHTRFSMIQIRETKNVEIMQLIEKKQEIEKHTDDFESLYRESKKAEKGARNEIDKYKIDKVKH